MFAAYPGAALASRRSTVGIDLKYLRANSFLVGAMAMASATFAQSQADLYRAELERLRLDSLVRVSPDIPVGQRAFIDYGLYTTFTYLTVDDSNNDSHALRQYDLIGYTRLNFDGAHEFFLRLRGTYRDFNNGDSFNGKGDDFYGFEPDIAYYRFDLARYLGSTSGQEINGNFIFQVGRDVVYWGNGLSLGQVLDGAMIKLSAGIFTLEGIAGVTPGNTIDFEASRPGFDDNTHRGYYGLMLSAQLGTHKPYIYGLLQQDYNDAVTTTLGTVNTTFGYDSYYLGTGSSGALTDHLSYSAEFVYEGGRSKSNSFVVSGPLLTPVEQTTDDITAMAANVRLDYAIQGPTRTRLSGEFLLASGDSNRLHTSNTFAGNLPGTGDHAFNAFSLVNTGQAFAPTVSNLIMLRGGVSSFPFQDVSILKRMQIGADVFAYAKCAQDGPIDEPTQDGRFLGWEPDFYVNWQVSSDVTLALRYGIFFPNEDVIGSDEARQFFSTSITIGL